MAASQDSWYQQRYGDAHVNKRQRQLYADRTAHYEEVKELHQEKRETYQHDAVAVFAEHGIATRYAAIAGSVRSVLRRSTTGRSLDAGG